MPHHWKRAILLLLTLVGAVGGTASVATAHRSGCHRQHSCPSDTGSYVCGDLGIDTYCPNRKTEPTATPVAEEAPLTSRPPVDWRSYDTSALFASFWTKNGGLALFGYAKTPLYLENGFSAQIFERNRLEYHPENQPPYTIQIGLIGEERLIQIGRIWQNEPRANAKPGCRFFEETGHNLCEPFLKYWRTHGLELDGKRGFSEAESLALFGYPVTENENGTQWFQRARFEDHGPEGVLLGLLGNEVYGTP